MIIQKIILFPKYLRIRKKIQSEGNKILFIGSSTYNNLGDHLLASNSLLFLRKVFPEYVIIEIPTQIYKRFSKELEKDISVIIPVIISGGGWMGSLWPEDEYMMQRMLSSFSDNKIIIFPQTIYYDLNIDNKKIIEDANRTYGRCSDLTLLVRDRCSFTTSKKQLNIEKIYLVPDMGLYGINVETNYKAGTVFCCFRNDREAMITSCVIQDIIRVAEERGFDISYYNTLLRHAVPEDERDGQINMVLKQIENAEVVITDRLHGMVFAVICGCRCLAIDNITHKVSGVYNKWLLNNPRVKLCDINKDDIYTMLNELLAVEESQKQWIISVNAEFEKLEHILRGIIK